MRSWPRGNFCVFLFLFTAGALSTQEYSCDQEPAAEERMPWFQDQKRGGGLTISAHAETKKGGPSPGVHASRHGRF